MWVLFTSKVSVLEIEGSLLDETDNLDIVWSSDAKFNVSNDARGVQRDEPTIACQ